MVQPPARLTEAELPPREYVFVMDVSGSMNGFPIDVSKQLLSDLVRHLKRSDRFNLVLFSGGSALLSETPLAATAENVERALTLIDNQVGGGGTEMLHALQRTLALPRARARGSRTYIIATDGYVDVEKEVFDLIRRRLGGSNFFAFGIGESVNRHLIEGIARVGRGEFFFICGCNEVAPQVERFRKYISSPALTRVSMEAVGFEVYALEPPALPDVLADRPVVVFGKWKGEPRGELRFKGMTAEGFWTQDLDVAASEVSEENSALGLLWARERIALLADFIRLGADDAAVNEVRRLGLRYGLLTEYTSFVAVDTLTRSDGTVERVEQPLPLPQGVSDFAVGGFAGGAPVGIEGGVPGGVGGGAVGGLPPMPEAAPPPLPVGGQLAEPRKLVHVNPTYPALALSARIQGSVFLECVIDLEGHVRDVRVLSGNPVLSEAALEAVQKWVYVPTLLNGVPVPVVTRVTVHFSLWHGRTTCSDTQLRGTTTP